MLRRTARFPDALIRPLPDLFKLTDQGPLQLPAGLALTEAAATPLMQRVHDLAIDVQLKLLRGGVSDPDGFRPLVSGKPGNFPFRQPPFPGKPVHDLKLFGIAGGRPEKPRPPRVRLPSPLEVSA